MLICISSCHRRWSGRGPWVVNHYLAAAAGISPSWLLLSTRQINFARMITCLIAGCILWRASLSLGEYQKGSAGCGRTHMQIAARVRYDFWALASLKLKRQNERPSLLSNFTAPWRYFCRSDKAFMKRDMCKNLCRFFVGWLCVHFIPAL